jgi:hypothetical protein
MAGNYRAKLIVATLGMAALAAFSVPAAAQQAAYAKIVLSKDSSVYLRIQAGELSTAMSPDGLDAAAAVKMQIHSTRFITFPEVTLPIPPDQLPAGYGPIKATLEWMRIWTPGNATATPHFAGQLTVSRTDDRKAKWEYTAQLSVEAASVIEKAPAIKLPNMDNIKAVLETAPSKGRLAISLRLETAHATLMDVLKDGKPDKVVVDFPGNSLIDVRKDGKPIEVKMVVTDSSGAEIASKTGGLTDFGFS